MNVMWFDGALRRADDIAVRPFTHALHYGSGVFEGIRAYQTPQGTAIFRMRDHLNRFFRSAQAYGLHIRFDVQRLEEAIFDTLDANGFTEGYIRPLAFYGERGISLAPRLHCPTHVLVALKQLRGSLIEAGAGARVCISPWQKTPSRSLPATVKASGHYMNSILALQDAIDRGFDDALLLNDRGEVAEATGENLFLVRGGRLKTNDASADALDGITRDSIICLARDRAIPVEIGSISVDDLFAADEIFLTGTAAEIMAVAQVNEHRLRPQRPVTERLCHAYACAVRGLDSHHTDWNASALTRESQSVTVLER